MAATPTLRPPLPLAKRLNRNALTVAAVLMGITVLTAVVLVRPSRERPESPAAPSAADDPAPVPSRPSFLEEPVRVPPPGGESFAAAARTPRSPAPALATGPSTDTNPPSLAASPEPAPVPARERAYWAALTSTALLRAPEAAGQTASPSPPAEGTPLAAEEQQLLNLGDSVLRASAGAASGVSAAPRGALSRRDRSHRAFLDAADNAHGATINARLEPAGSPYTLRAGTVLPGLLVTGINSDLPGDLVGQVSRDVYDSRTERICLIPKGARLIGTYDNQVVAGEARLLVAWTRLIFPDGRSLKLPGLALKDPAGQSGVQGELDTHWARVFGKAVLLSAIGAGAQLSQPQQTSAFAAPSAGQVAAGALGQELSSVALEILRRGLDAPPTITIPAGQPFNVFLNGDLVFDAPYQEEGPGTPFVARQQP